MAVADDSGVSVRISKVDETETVIIFQCSQCNSIVGDSTSWVSADKTMRTITLRSTTSRVGIKTNLDVSGTGVDKGSTYYAVYCVPCNEVLGKQYIASSPQLDYLRGCFTFLAEKLNSYEVGSAEVSCNSDLADMMSVPSPQYMHTQINKIRYLIMSMNERLQALENHVPGDTSGPPLSGVRRKTGNEVQQDICGREEDIPEDAVSVTSTENLSTKVRRYSSSTTMTEEADINEMQRFMSSKQDYQVTEAASRRQSQNQNVRDIQIHSNESVGSPGKKMNQSGNGVQNSSYDKLQEEQSHNAGVSCVGHNAVNRSSRRIKAVNTRQHAAGDTQVNNSNPVDRAYGHSNSVKGTTGMYDIRSPKATRAMPGRNITHKVTEQQEVVEQGASTERNGNQSSTRRSEPSSTDMEQWPSPRGANSGGYRVTKKRKISPYSE